DFDPLAKQRSDLIFQVWIQNLLRNRPEELAGKLAARHCPGTPTTASRLPSGAFNICYRVTFQTGPRVVVRFTALGRILARTEKVDDEIATMKSLAQHSTIRVPQVFGSGKCAVGPYIVMEYIAGRLLLSDYLRDPSHQIVKLNSHISASVLKTAYSIMADLLLELCKPTFPFIGAIHQDDTGEWTAQKRPLTFNMNRLAQFSAIPHSVFSQDRFANAADYFDELAGHHMHHFLHQRNDAVGEEQRLSAGMEGSLENGMFWVSLALRNSALFDEVYWGFLDRRFFGEVGGWEEREGLLSDEERVGMEGVVGRKMREREEGGLAEGYGVDEILQMQIMGILIGWWGVGRRRCLGIVDFASI
ncbi:hypothetical protein BO71DRAFT_328890, partial [Aspergillus ellipticus CBS 707.79]